MVSTYTDNLRLTKQGDNDNPNTWGQIVNQQVIELLEEAISGVVQVNCTGTSDINLATSVQNGLTDTARHAVLELIGLIGADINVILPSVEKVYIVRTSYAGDYTVTLKTSGGSDSIKLNSGSLVLIYTNGVNIYSVSSLGDGIYGDVTVSDSGKTISINNEAVGVSEVSKTIITGQDTAVLSSDDKMLISDTDDDGKLKEVSVLSLVNLAGGSLLNVVPFTESGTYTKNTAASKLLVIGTGAGGGGGLIGNGADGGNTTFGSFFTAYGGSGGKGYSASGWQADGGKAGNATGGTINLYGSDGDPPIYGTANSPDVGGRGGSSFWGGGASCVMTPNTAAGKDAVVYGAGGGGGINSYTNSGAGGGGGGTCISFIDNTSVGDTVAVTIGAGGAGDSGGMGGGDGADGILVVLELN
jgi:hypothetical protein